MNDQQAFEREVETWIVAEASTSVPDQTLSDILVATGRQRPLPRWLALIKEPPMRISSNVAIGSPMARVAAIMVATLLLALTVAGAGIAGSRLFAADGAIIVAQDGSGDFTTIAAAVDAAQDGETIMVRPGTYIESIVVADIDLDIRGDGDRDDIIVESAATEPPAEFEAIFWSDSPAWAFILADTESELSNMTIVGPASGIGIASVGSDASTTLDGLVVRMPEATGDENPVNWNDGAGGVLRNSIVEGWLGIGPDARIVIEGNTLPATCVVLWDSGTDLVVRDNTIHGCPYEKGIDVFSGNTVLIEGNDIWVEDIPAESRNEPAIRVEAEGTGGGTITIRDNDVHDSPNGIVVEADSTTTVEISGNRIHDNTRLAASAGVRIGPGSVAVIADNIITSNSVGVQLMPAAEATLSGNEITGNGSGLVIFPGDSMTLIEDNVICNNDKNLDVSEETASGLAGSNEICQG